MLTETEREEVFIEGAESSSRKVVAALSALVITALVFVGYAYLRKRHAQASLSQSAAATQPRPAPQALILVDEALLQGSNSVLGGTVRNISNVKLGALSVEIEVKRRKDGISEKKMALVNPADLDAQQEGRYSLQLKAQDYVSAKVVALRRGTEASEVPYTVAQGEKRPPERLESKTITIDKAAPGKRSEFLNSPENPARVP